MTAEVDVHGEMSELSKGELDDKCGLDLPKGGRECNGLSHHDEAPIKVKENGNGKDDTDGSYVFVSGNDAVGDDPVEKDDNGNGNVGSANKESEGGVGELKVENNEAFVQSCADGNCVAENNNGVVLEGSGGESDESEVGRTGACEEHNGTVAVVESEPQQHDSEVKAEEQIKVEPSEDIGEIKESQIMDSEAAECECKSPQVVDGKEEDVDDSNSDSVQESQVKIVNSAESEPHQLDNGEEKVESESNLDSDVGRKENQESQIIVTEKEPLELTNEIPVKDSSEEHGVELEQNLKNDSCPAAVIHQETEAISGPVSDENGDGLPTGHTSDLDIGVKENQKCQIMVSEDVQIELGHWKEPVILADESPAEVPQGDLGMDLEQNSETVSSPIADVQSEKEVANGPVTDESGDCLPSGHAQDSVSESKVINDLVVAGQNSPEQNESIGNAKSLPSPVDCGKAPIESGECLPSAPDSDTILESDVGVGASVVESSPACAVDDATLEADDGEKLDAKSCESMPSPVDCGKALIESGECLPSAPDGDTILESDVGVGASVVESSPACAVDDPILEADDGEKLNVKSCESFVPCPVDDTNIEIEDEKSPVGGDTMSSCPADDVRLETEIRFGSVDYECKLSTSPNGDVNRESEMSYRVTERIQLVPVDDIDADSCVIDSVKNESSLPTGVGAESEVENASAVNREMPAATVSESELLSSSVTTSENALNCVPDVVENGDQFTGGDSCDKPTCQDPESIDGIHRAETPTSSQDGSTVDALEGQNAGAEVGKRPFYFLIRIPRYDDIILKKEIQLAQLQVDEKTQNRDAIRAGLQIKKATCKEYNDNFEAALSEERAARDLLRSKRQEIDSVQSVINRVKNLISLEDIEGRIRNMEHMMQHETLPLKEEKQLIREIKQMNKLREQISSTMGTQDEVQLALDQKDQIEERLKLLRKEADLLRDNLSKAEAVTTAAKKKYNDENEKLHQLQAQFRAADDIRQKAYTHLQSLRKKLYEKNKYFWNYRDAAKVANDHAVNKDRESLQCLCVNQVETIMELWNKNDEFRKDYNRCNARSTLRRLRTLDGRSLGPDEEPPVIPNVVNERVTKDNSVSLNSTPKIRKEVVPVEAEKGTKEKGADKSMAKVVEQKNETAKTIKPAKPAPLVNGAATVSGRDEIEEVRREEHKRTKEEEELARKAEEVRKEEEAAKLKEQLRLEEKAKAKEALERKKRIADKAQTRAALRAQKEAELKEKEKEKKARKKERKKAGGGEAADGINEGESAPISETPTETPQESETREKPVTITKRTQKPSQFAKQTKAKSIPLPLRNRGKRRMQPWMWILLTALLVLALFLVGNSSFSSKFGWPKSGF